MIGSKVEQRSDKFLEIKREILITIWYYDLNFDTNVLTHRLRYWLHHQFFLSKVYWVVPNRIKKCQKNRVLRAGLFWWVLGGPKNVNTLKTSYPIQCSRSYILRIWFYFPMQCTMTMQAPRVGLINGQSSFHLVLRSSFHNTCLSIE